MLITSFLIFCSSVLVNNPFLPRIYQKNPQAQAFICETESLIFNGEYQHGIMVLNRNLEISRRKKQVQAEAGCLIGLGIISWNIGNTAEASVYLKRAQSNFLGMGDFASSNICLECLQIISHYNKGKDYRNKGLYILSLNHLSQAIGKARKLCMAGFEVKCIRQKGVTYWEMGEKRLFLRCNERALALSLKYNNLAEKARSLNNISVFYCDKSEYSKAIRYLEEAINFSRLARDSQTEAECLNNLGIVYRDIGDLKKAFFYLLNALEIDNRMGASKEILKDLNNIGSLIIERALENQNVLDLGRAETILKKSISLAMLAPEDSALMYSILNNFGVIMTAYKQYEKAREYFQLALAIVEKKKIFAGKQRILNNIAFCYLNEKNINMAITIYSAALESNSNIEPDLDSLESYFGIGQCYDYMREYGKALYYYRLAVEGSEVIRGKINLDIYRLGFSRRKMDPYRRTINLLYLLYRRAPSEKILNEIFTYIERARITTFLEKYNGRESGYNQNKDRHIVDRIKEISEKISTINKGLMDRIIKREERLQVLRELERAEDTYFRLLESSDREIGSGYSLTRNNTIFQLQQIMNEKTALIEYFLGEERSYLFFISKNRAELIELPNMNEIERSINGYIKFIGSPPTGTAFGYSASLRIAKQLLPSDILNNSREYRSLIIIPDGILFLLPFEALCLVVENKPQYLIEKMSISYCLSTSALLMTLERDSRPYYKKDILAIGGLDYEINTEKVLESDFGFEVTKGNNLVAIPYSRKEVLEIASIFPKNREKLLLGQQATEEEFKKAPLNDFRIIHFSCHAILNEGHYIRSGLAMSRSEQQTDDGFLQVREICGMKIDCELIVLSACDSGKGEAEQGLTKIGIFRAFLIAGARSVLASLWAVNDKTTIVLMRDFYQQLFSGKSTSDSLRLAKLNMIDSRYSHPFYWACFILFGDPDAVRLGR